MQQNLLIPVINAKGVAAHPYAPLEVGMLVYQNARLAMIQPENVRKAAHVFNWQRSFWPISLEDDMIDWVEYSPLLTKPIFMLQMNGCVNPYPYDEHFKGVPIQHSLRRCVGYAGMILTLFDHGDTYQPGNVLFKSRAEFLNQIKNNNPEIQFPTENYITPTTWVESSPLIPNEHAGLETTYHRKADA
ncbi:hypothetical protein D6R99_08165 [Salmonella enterica subsp. enterica]|nr:hypothetical protein [Salmonella enterica subsp. enterica serovar Paratyphi B]